MKSWFKKAILGSALCFSTTIFALPEDSKDLLWYRKNYDKYKESIQIYLENTSLYPILKEPSFDLHLAKDPIRTQKTDNFTITIISGIIEQEKARLFALFFVYQQLNPFSTNAWLLYTGTDKLHMPSVELYIDVCKFLFIVQKNLPEDFKVHIINTGVDKNFSYTQDWLFYNETETKKFTLFFTPDGAGGTSFSLPQKL